jgi:hypothetical protein
MVSGGTDGEEVTVHRTALTPALSQRERGKKDTLADR